MKKIKIILKEKSYPVYTGSGIIQKLPELISLHRLNKNLFVILDDNVNRIYGKYVRKIFSNSGGRIAYYILKPGEDSKSLKNLSLIYSSLMKNNFGRDTLLISIGGGVTGDIAGYAASTYMRGVQLIHIPTTIISMVDSSIGGKTGINFNGIKNIIGSFYQPEFVLTDTDFLSTLPEDEIHSGTGEIIKYAFLTDVNFFNYVNKNLSRIYSLDRSVLKKIISVCVSFKGAIIKLDEREEGLRKILNLGHTFAHAFESASGFQVKHGEAVIAGIISSLFLSSKAGLLADRRLKELLKLPLKAKLSSYIDLSNYNLILKYMQSDKKRREGKIRFVLLSDIGKIFTDVNVSKSDILYSIKKMNEVLSSGSV